jgi:hypothetical protein
MKPIDTAIIELRAVEAQMDALKAKGEDLRKEIFGIIENEGLTDGYKNENATVSYVERKTVKINDEKKLLDDLSQQKIVKYIQEIPAHLELTPDFTKDVKAGKFTHPEIEIQTAHNLAIRFN